MRCKMHDVWGGEAWDAVDACFWDGMQIAWMWSAGWLLEVFLRGIKWRKKIALKMRFASVMILCLSVMAFQLPRGCECTLKLAKEKYQKAVGLGREYMKKACSFFEQGKETVTNKVTDMMNQIRNDKKESIATVDGNHEDHEASELSPEKVQALIEEIKRRLEVMLKGEPEEDREQKEEEDREQREEKEKAQEL